MKKSRRPRVKIKETKKIKIKNYVKQLSVLLLLQQEVTKNLQRLVD